MIKKLKSYTIVPQDLYVFREADRQLESSIMDMGRPPYILVARQMGKTNLLINAKRNLPVGDDLFVYIDMSNSFQSSRECFRNIIDRIIETNDGQLDHLNADILKNRQIKQSTLSAHAEHGRELRTCLRGVEGKIVIILDEIDALTKSTFSDEIFSQIRSIYFERVNFPEYERLTYVLSGVAEPSEIIKNSKISPFNIGQKIFLNDFSFEEFSEFLNMALISIDDELKNYLYSWTMGNPRMSWEICSQLEELVDEETELSTQLIDEVVNSTYLTSFDRPPVDHIRDLVASDVAIRNAIVEIKYGKGDQVSDNVRRKLYLSGIINSLSLSGTVRFKNKIIELALSDKWLKDITSQTKDFFSAGNTAFDKANYTEALINYKEYLATNPRDIPEVFNWKIAICYFRTNDYLKAIEYFDLFEINRSQFEDIYYQKMHLEGLCYAYLSKYPESKQAFDEVVNSGRINFQYFDSKLSLLYLETVMLTDYDLSSLKDRAISYLNDFENHKNTLTNAQFIELVFTAEHIVGHYYKGLGDIPNAILYTKRAIESAPLISKPKMLLALYEIEKTESIITEVIDFIIDKQLKPYQFDAADPHALTTSILYSIVIEAYKVSLFEYRRICDYIIAEIYADGMDEYDLALYVVGYINKFLIAEKATAINMLERIVNSERSKNDSDFEFEVIREIAYTTPNVSTYDRMYMNAVKKEHTLLTPTLNDLMIFAKNIRHLIQTERHSSALPLVELALSYSDAFERSNDFNLSIVYYYRLLIYKKLRNKIEIINSANKVVALLGKSADTKNLLAEREFLVVQNEALDALKLNVIQTVTNKHKYSRNDKVRVMYQNGMEKEGKYKNFEPDIQAGKCNVIEG